jgi:uncharacterized membrane protein
MNENLMRITIAGVLVTVVITVIICALIFNTPFAKNTVDYFSFVAALFLMADGFYKIRRYKAERYFPHQLLRHIRIIIGASIFTIHSMQYVYGV